MTIATQPPEGEGKGDGEKLHHARGIDGILRCTWLKYVAPDFKVNNRKRIKGMFQLQKLRDACHSSPSGSFVFRENFT